jgi:hypothetical protein
MSKNIFESWVMFREKKYGNSRTDILSLINNKNGTRLTSAAISHYCSGVKAVPDRILEIVESDFDEFIRWLLVRSGIVFDEKSVNMLSSQILFPIKRVK